MTEKRPAHDLQFAAVKGKRCTTAGRRSSTVGVPVVHVHTRTQDREEFLKRVPLWLAEGITRQVARDDVQRRRGRGKGPKISTSAQVSRLIVPLSAVIRRLPKVRVADGIDEFAGRTSAVATVAVARHVHDIAAQSHQIRI